MRQSENVLRREPNRVSIGKRGRCSAGVFFRGSFLAVVVLQFAVSHYLLASTPQGQVIGWGQTTVPADLNNIVAIAAGANFRDPPNPPSFAVRPYGSVVSWGNNAHLHTNVPVSLNSVVSVAAGAGHYLALKSDGTVLGWGFTSGANVPKGLSNVVAIAAGWSHSLGLRVDGTVEAWGWNDDGQTNVPIALSNVVAISAGGYHSLALKNDGHVVGWGGNDFGQRNAPAGLSNAVAIAAGFSHSLALRSDGTVLGWGYNQYGQRDVPSGLGNVISISAAGFHNLALKSDGAVVAWGWNAFGQTNVPAGLSNVVAIAAGGRHSLAIQVDQPTISLMLLEQSPTLCFRTFAGRLYSVEYSSYLTPDSWTGVVGGNVIGNGYDALVMDTNACADTPMRFYRIKLTP